MCVTVDVCASALLVVCASQARSQALCWGGGGGGGAKYGSVDSSGLKGKT